MNNDNVENLETLASAISDVGYWTWWVSDLPAIFQLEFGGTQLYFPQADGSKPASQVALQFQNPLSISFLTKQFDSEDGENWFEELHHDRLSPPTCNYDQFTLTDTALMASLLQQANHIYTLHGYAPSDVKFMSAPFKIVFWAGNYGCAVSAENLKLLSANGKVELEQIPQLHGDWWEYWQRYWAVRETDSALPKDYACEVTIPAGQ